MRHVSGVRNLSLYSTSVTDAGLQQLTALEGLRLKNPCAGVTSGAVAHLASLPKLQCVRMFRWSGRCGLTRAVLTRALAHVPDLYLDWDEYYDAVVEPLGRGLCAGEATSPAMVLHCLTT